MDGLISAGVFDNKTWQLVEAEVHSAKAKQNQSLRLYFHFQKTDQLRAAKLLDLLPSRGPKAFQIFLDCLRFFVKCSEGGLFVPLHIRR